MTTPRQVDVRAALEQLPLPAAMLAPDGTIVWLNTAAREHLGNLVGTRYTNIFAPESTNVAKDDFARKILGDAPSSEFEAVIARHDGTRIAGEVNAVRIENEGRVLGVFGLFVPERRLPAVQGGRLTPRQAEVLRHLASGSSTQQIADGLGISVETARNHIRRLLKQLDAHSRLEAVIEGRNRGLI
jgi:PAS domain S-box-containing protein